MDCRNVRTGRSYEAGMAMPPPSPKSAGVGRQRVPAPRPGFGLAQLRRRDDPRGEDKDRLSARLSGRVDALLEKLEERRIMVLSDMLNIPQTRATDTIPVAQQAEPRFRRRIKRWPVPVAQQ